MQAARCTAVNILLVINLVLTDFLIEKDQIISITTDSAANCEKV